MELIGGAGGSGNAGAVGGLESGLAGDAEGCAEAGDAVGGAGEAPLAEVIREESVSAVGDASAVEEELSGGAGEGGGGTGPDASSEGVGGVSREASSVDAHVLEEEEAVVADVAADAVLEVLAVGALGH